MRLELNALSRIDDATKVLGQKKVQKALVRYTVSCVQLMSEVQMWPLSGV